MPNSSAQVFQSSSRTRWRRFKWTMRIVLFIFLFLIAAFVIALWQSNNPNIPQLKNKSERYKKIAQGRENLLQEKKINTKFIGFKNYIEKKYQQLFSTHKIPINNNIACPVRAAFYVAWDAQSYFSLRNNISKLNMILPEWFFIDPTKDSVYVNIDQRALKIIQSSNVKIIPILSNFYKEAFDGESIHRIITNPAKKQRIINQVIILLQQYHFQGINIDFEELKESNDEYLIQFQKELYNALHAKGLIVTQDVSPFNNDYNYKELSQYNDYIFLMAYDEHSSDGNPGPISAQKWIEAAVDAAIKEIPLNKLILCLAAYGYDWPEGSVGSDITYQEALTIAAESNANVDFDNDTYNLHFSYYDDNNIAHDVYFNDAATNFNTMRFAVEYGLAGVALWRLGSEDSRLWKFYDRDLDKNALSHFDLHQFTYVSPSNDVDYIGEGEVLDVITEPKEGKISPEMDTAEMLISEEKYDSLPSMFIVQKYGKADKKMVLTFDDGPDPEYTGRILDILGKEHVSASFFLIGINAEDNIPLVKRIYREGYEIGNHTFTHPNMAEVSRGRANLEMKATRLLIESITGHSTILFRPPYNADAEPETLQELIPVAQSRKANYLTIGESIDPQDWEEGVTADSIYSRIIAQQDKGSIILLHDAGGDRSATVAALPKIIRYFKQKGYTFTTIADILGKTKDELMPPVPKGSAYYFVQFNYLLAQFGYWGGHILFSLFMIAIVLSICRIALIAFFAIKQKIKESKEILPFGKHIDVTFPLVSIIIPAYNEEVNAINSLNNLLKADYPNVEFIFVDDGSKDDTYNKVSTAFGNHPKIKILTKLNGGKASALNFGIEHSAADYVICIDADTRLKRNAVEKLMQHFNNEKVGAVAGNVKVGNQINLLTKWQSIEYITSQNFDRKAFAYLNALTVVPGAIGAFRKDAIASAGGFTRDTLAEDCDLTIRILRQGYIVANESKAIAFTEAPEKIRMFLKQRFRWTFGVMQTFWKNRDAFFNGKYKWLGWIALPNILVFQFLIPTLIPFADLFMLVGIITGNAGKMFLYYAIFMLIDLSVSLLAFRFEKEKIWKLIWLFPQRIIYRWLMGYVLFKAGFRAIKGELQHWGVLKRTGNVQEVH